ncbi:MAG: hypothetical protein D6744_15240 [Planctomycetota bacterium]|nr:MAG: hypothetical protein D6744_15240 [Planctomycetota bacterium]
MTSIQTLIPIARRQLVVTGANGEADVWLWEHTQRVALLAETLCAAPELADTPPDRTVVRIAALFSNVGWAQQVQQGQIPAWQALGRPTNELQREAAIGALREAGEKVLDAETLATASETIRQSGDRYTNLPEAQVLSDAENLADIGFCYFLRQYRRYRAEGRSTADLIASWNRQREYQYWDARINEGLRFELSRRAARERLAALDRLLAVVAHELDAGDVRKTFQDAGVELADSDLDFDVR